MELTDGYSLFFHCWPWMGLGAAITLTIIAFTTNLLRSNLSVSRWKDPTFIAWLGAIEYMFHNFEEFGVDFAGHTLGFAYMMNEMGLGAAVTEGAYLGCNIPFVWITGPVLAVLSRRYPALCGAMPLFALVNGLGHVAQLPNVGYNPGVATSIVLFIPLGIYTIYAFYGKRKMFSWKTLWLTLGVAVVYMVCIMGCIGLANASMLTGNVSQLTFITLCTFGVGFLFWLVARNAKANKPVSRD